MKALPLSLHLLALAIPGALMAQEKTNLDIPRVSGEMKADGKLDEPFWQQAANTTLAFEVSPGENIPAAVNTKVYIADSGTSLRIAYRAEDPNPEKITAILRLVNNFF